MKHIYFHTNSAILHAALILFAVACFLCLGQTSAFVFAQEPAPAVEKASPALPEEDVDQEIQTLIQKLGDPSWKVRHAAGQRLVEIGQDAEPALQAAMESPDLTVSKSAEYLYPMITNELARATDSPRLHALLVEYEGTSDLQKIVLIEQIGRLPREESQEAILRIINAEGKATYGRYAMLTLLWNLPVNIHFPQLLDNGSQNLPTLAAAALATVPETGAARNLLRLKYCSEQKPWLTLRKETVEGLLKTAKAMRRKKPVLEQLITLLETEQKYLGEMLRILESPRDVKESEAFGETLDKFYTDLITNLANSMSSSERSLEMTTLVGLSYYACDFIDRLGYPRSAETLLRKIQGTPRLNHNTATYNSGEDRKLWVKFRLQWITTLTTRGHVGWALLEGDKLWQNSGPVEKALVASFVANMYHALQDDKRASELLGSILSEGGLNLEGLRSLGSDVTVEKFTGLMKYYQANVACREKDYDRARQLLRESEKLQPEDTEGLILAYETARDTGNEAWLKETDEKIEKLLALSEARIKKLASGDASPRDKINLRNRYAWLAGKTNRHLAQAATYAELNVKESPQDGGIRDTLSHVYFAAGHLDDAILHQQRAITDSPESLEVRRAMEVFQAEKARRETPEISAQ